MAIEFQPGWQAGMSWQIELTSKIPGRADLATQYAEFRYDVSVISVPVDGQGVFTLEFRDTNGSDIYSLEYRASDLSLSRFSITTNEGTRVLGENGATPYLWLQRGLPIIPDFPIRTGTKEEIEYLVDEKTVTLQIENAVDSLEFTITHKDPTGSLVCLIEWHSGDPWWSHAECKEVPLTHIEGLTPELVAAGDLVEGSVRRR